VRELENEIQRLVIQADAGVIVGLDLLSPELRKVEGVIAEGRRAKGSLKDRVEQVENSSARGAARARQQQDQRRQGPGHHARRLHKKLKQLGIA
jgi:Nif-specific regulatory protein